MAPNDSSAVVPHGYMYLYADGHCSLKSYERNGCKPIQAVPYYLESALAHSREEAAAAALARSREALQAVEELYPQTYACAYGSSEYTHINPDDWKEAIAKVRDVLAALKADAEGRK